jgi:hypothetical protein
LMLFWFLFPLWLRILNIPWCIYWPFVLFWKLSVHFICPFIHWIACSFGVNFWSSLYILDISLLFDE